MNQLDAKIVALEDVVQSLGDAVKVATDYIAGEKARLEAAIADAVSKGATPEQLNALTNLAFSIGQNSIELLAAVPPVVQPPQPVASATTKRSGIKGG